MVLGAVSILQVFESQCYISMDSVEGTKYNVAHGFSFALSSKDTT